MMYCNDFRGLIFLLVVLTVAMLCFSGTAKPAPTLHRVDYLEAEVCGHNAVFGAGEDEVALVILDGDISEFVNRYCVPADPNISTYYVGNVTGVMRNGIDYRVLLDGALVDGSDGEAVGDDYVDVGDTMMVRVRHASRVLEPVYTSRSRFGVPLMWSQRGKRAMEVLSGYRMAKGMEADNGK